MKSLPPPSSCAAISAFSKRHLAGNTCSAVPGGILLLQIHTAFAVTLTRNIRKLRLSKKYMPCQKGGWRFGCFYPASPVPSLAMLSFRGLSVFCEFIPSTVLGPAILLLLSMILSKKTLLDLHSDLRV